MWRFIKRLFGWTTLISLMFWTGVASYLLMVQPISALPAGYPATVAECRVRWAQPLIYKEVRDEAVNQCNRYYALMGDRGAPYLARLREQVITRVTSLILTEYLQNNRPNAGQTVTGVEVVDTIGVKRIGQLLLQTITHAHDPYEIVDKAEARCRLDQVRQVQAAYDLAMIPQTCAQQR